jgi:hypothetical protein
MILAAVVLAHLASTPGPESLPSDLLEGLSAAPPKPFFAEPGDDWKFSYTYVELGLGKYDIDDFDEDSDTLYGRASLGLFNFLYVFLDYSNQSTDFEDTDTDMFGLGVGGHFDVSNRLNLVGEASWLSADVSSDLPNLDDKNDGWMAFAGARYMALPIGNGGLEVNGGFRWIDVKGVFSDDEIGAWEAGARYHFNHLLSAGAKYQFLEDDGFWGIDARVSF